MPTGVTIKAFYDRTDLVKRTIKTVETNLLEGAALVIAVLFLLLGNIRAAIIVALSIPLSMLFAVSFMVKLGIAGSLMSLGAIDFGLIVDGSVVMVENTLRRLAERDRGPGRFLHTIVEACAEVGRPILFGVGIIIVVYLPILTLQGVEGKLFTPDGAHGRAGAGRITPPDLHGDAGAGLALPARTRQRARGISRPAAEARLPARPRLVPCASPARARLWRGSRSLVALLVAPFLGAEFIPRLDEGAIALQVLRLPSVSLEESVQQATMVERQLRGAFPDEIETIVSKTGTARDRHRSRWA